MGNLTQIGGRTTEVTRLGQRRGHGHQKAADQALGAPGLPHQRFGGAGRNNTAHNHETAATKVMRTAACIMFSAEAAACSRLPRR